MSLVKMMNSYRKLHLRATLLLLKCRALELHPLSCPVMAHVWFSFFAAIAALIAQLKRHLSIEILPETPDLNTTLLTLSQPPRDPSEIGF